MTILVWQSSEFPTDLESGRLVDVRQLLLDRGIMPLCNPCANPERARSYIPVFPAPCTNRRRRSATSTPHCAMRQFGYLMPMTSKLPTAEHIMQLAWGHAPPLIIYAGVKHGVFDALDGLPKTVPQLVKQTRASARGLTAILNALVGLRMLTKKGDRYALAPESAAFLVSGKPSYLGAFFGHVVQHLIPKWLRISDVVRTGKPAIAVNDKSDGSKFFAEFVEALFPLNYPAASALAEHLRLDRSTGPIRVLDLAAGSGVWGIALAQRSPDVQLTIVDWPDVLKVTRKVARRHGLGNRLTSIPGDLLKVDYGTGHNIATLGHILHSEGRERSRRLLKKTFRALSPHGTIAIGEFLVKHDRTGPPMGLLFAVNMLINTNVGDAFSFEEIRGWLREAGFRRPRLLDVGTHSPLILATKP